LVVQTNAIAFAMSDTNDPFQLSYNVELKNVARKKSAKCGAEQQVVSRMFVLRCFPINHFTLIPLPQLDVLWLNNARENKRGKEKWLSREKQ